MGRSLFTYIFLPFYISIFFQLFIFPHPKIHYFFITLRLFIIPDGKYSVFIITDGKYSVFIITDRKYSVFIIPDRKYTVFIIPDGKYTVFIITDGKYSVYSLFQMEIIIIIIIIYLKSVTQGVVAHSPEP